MALWSSMSATSEPIISRLHLFVQCLHCQQASSGMHPCISSISTGTGRKSGSAMEAFMHEASLDVWLGWVMNRAKNCTPKQTERFTQSESKTSRVRCCSEMIQASPTLYICCKRMCELAPFMQEAKSYIFL